MAAPARARMEFTSGCVKRSSSLEGTVNAKLDISPVCCGGNISVRTFSVVDNCKLYSGNYMYTGSHLGDRQSCYLRFADFDIPVVIIQVYRHCSSETSAT